MTNQDICIGITGESRQKVAKENLASAYGNPGVEVYASPALMALIEQACINAITGKFDPVAKMTVGARMEMDHLAPTPEGYTVAVKARLAEVKAAKLVFEATASDGVEEVARATHIRFLVDRAAFFDKVAAKAAKNSQARS